MDKRKKLKPLSQRKPKEFLSFNELLKDISNDTDFRQTEIRKVLGSFISTITRNLENKKSVRIPKLGIFYPAIKRSRPGVSLNGGLRAPEKMIVPDRWMLRFLPSSTIRDRVSKLSVSKEEIRDMYR